MKKLVGLFVMSLLLTVTIAGFLISRVTIDKVQAQDALFDKQDKLGEKFYVDIAKKLKLDLSQFNQQCNSEEVNAVIEKDKQLALKLGLRGTPFFFINGETFSGAVPLSQMESILSGLKAKSQVESAT